MTIKLIHQNYPSILFHEFRDSLKRFLHNLFPGIKTQKPLEFNHLKLSHLLLEGYNAEIQLLFVHNLSAQILRSLRKS